MDSIWKRLTPPIYALAPMEDVTDTVFRRIVARAGKPDVFFTEFVSTDGLCSEGYEAVSHRLRYTEEERPIIAQIWGNSPENYRTASRMIRELGFDGIDINMGCPVKKIVKDGHCSALIDNPTLASELITAAREGAGDLPVSVKTRLGFKTKKTIVWTSFLLEHDLPLLTMHGRIARDMSDVPADWDEISRVAALRDESGKDTLIFGNGDVTTREQMLSYPPRYGVDGVMVARGIFHDLMIFTDENEQWDGETGGVESRINRYLEHIELYRKTWGDNRNFNIMKKFAKVYVSGFPGAAKLRNDLMESSSYDEMIATLKTLRPAGARSVKGGRT